MASRSSSGCSSSIVWMLSRAGGLPGRATCGQSVGGVRCTGFGWPRPHIVQPCSGRSMKRAQSRDSWVAARMPLIAVTRASGSAIVSSASVMSRAGLGDVQQALEVHVGVGEGEDAALDGLEGLERGATSGRRDHVTVLRRDALDVGPALLDARQAGREELTARHVVLVEGRGVGDDVVDVVGHEDVVVGDEAAEQVRREERRRRRVVGHHRAGEVQVRRELELQFAAGRERQHPVVLLDEVVREPMAVVLEQRGGAPLRDDLDVVAREAGGQVRQRGGDVRVRVMAHQVPDGVDGGDVGDPLEGLLDGQR